MGSLLKARVRVRLVNRLFIEITSQFDPSQPLTTSGQLDPWVEQTVKIAESTHLKSPEFSVIPKPLERRMPNIKVFSGSSHSDLTHKVSTDSGLSLEKLVTKK